MYEIQNEIRQQYENVLNQKYKKLLNDYNDLKYKVSLLYKENIDTEIYCNKLKYCVDDIAISKEDNELFQTYVIDKNTSIKTLLKKEYLLKEKKIAKLFDIRIKMLNKRIERLDMNNIGTTLNVLGEFHNDVLLDLERNKKQKSETDNTPFTYHSIILESLEATKTSDSAITYNLVIKDQNKSEIKQSTTKVNNNKRGWVKNNEFEYFRYNEE